MGKDQDAGVAPATRDAGFTPAKSGASIRVKVEPKFKIDLQVSYDDPHSEGTIDGPEGLTVDLMDAELFDDTVVTLTTGPDGRLVHEMTWTELREKCGEQTPDLYLLLRLKGKYIDPKANKVVDKDHGGRATLLAFAEDLSTKEGKEVSELYMEDTAVGLALTGDLEISPNWAWPHSAEWDADAIDAYRAMLPAAMDAIYASKDDYTCEDFALKLLIDFAVEHGLPLAIKNGSGLYRSTDNSYAGDDMKYEIAVHNSTAARDLQHHNTKPLKSWSDLETGDIILRIPAGGKNADHIQVVYANGGARLVMIAQGGFFLPRHVATGDRDGYRPYIGKRIRMASYDFPNKTYSKTIKTYWPGSDADADDGESTGKDFDELTALMQFGRWPFTEWN